MRLESRGNARSIRIQIVISENRHHPETRMQLRQKAGAGFGSAGSEFCSMEPAMKYRERNKVAGQNDQIRMQVVDDFYRRSQGHRREAVVVKIAELRYGEAIESSRQPGELDFHRRQYGAVWLKNCGVFCQDQGAGRGGPRSNLKKPPSS